MQAKPNLFKPVWSLASVAAALTLAGTRAQAANPHAIELSPLGVYTSAVFDAGAAEIVAHDPQHQNLFVINAQAATVDVLSLSDPAHPQKIATIDVTPYGAVANSVAVRDGIVAVAVENAVKTEPGKVVFFDTALNFLSQVTVGALPDMVTFTPNDRYVLVANEGEPSTNYLSDPEGSVSIIDLAQGAALLTQAKVRTAGFASFNNVPLDPSIRVFGPGASVAKDMEPEYIAVSHDSKTAYVTCQENNALATIDIKSATVTSLKGLGFKDHSRVDATTALYTVDPATLPAIGTTAGGQTLTLGGFSGLHFDGVDPVTGHLRFITHTDRGPNAEPTGVLRPFLLPDFAPEIVFLNLDRATGALTVTERLPLQRAPGVPLSGRPNTSIGASASTPHNDEVPVDLFGNVLSLDLLGGDFEGLVTDTNGTFWMVDEYRPAIYHFDTDGVLMQRYVPMGAADAAGLSPGSLGTEALPKVLAQRRQNRGFEGIAYDGGKLYAFVQSPLRNPATLSNGALNLMRNIRVLEFNPTTLATRQFIYEMDNTNAVALGTRPDKLGDAVSFGNGEFLVLERDDDDLSNVADPAHIEKRIYRFNLTGATDVSSYTGTVGVTGLTVDQLSAAQLRTNGIQPIVKTLHVDLNAAGYNQAEKVEGLAVVDASTLAVINDNDFGVAGITINTNNGTFVLNPGYVPEPEQLGLITVSANALDASDRDSKINIRQWPVKGMYLPDGIASYKIGSETYLVTANEGDVREYSAFAEAVRVGSSSVVLDPARFPDASVLKNNANLGRLNITTTRGRNAVTGVYEELYAFGARSFSIWTTDGAQLFDSADDLEWLTALTTPANFNASNSSNDRDSRSDDKGPEPEGVTIGKAFGTTYAFIGLERIGGVVVYDVENPLAPELVDYVNVRDFAVDVRTAAAGDLGPEGLLFISEEDSPNGLPLLVIGNEISGTTRILQINKVR